jgi:MFS family permease
MYTLGGVCAFFPNIYLPDRYGRRWAMFICNIIQVYVHLLGYQLTVRSGAIITANARNMEMLLVGRFITGLGTAASATAAKSYLAEVTPNRSRGRYMGVQNSFYYVGQILATGITVCCLSSLYLHTHALDPTRSTPEQQLLANPIRYPVCTRRNQHALHPILLGVSTMAVCKRAKRGS